MKNKQMYLDLKEWQKEGRLHLICHCNDTGGFLERDKSYTINNVTSCGESIYFHVKSEKYNVTYCVNFNDDDFELVIK